jgi:hypothetical protein
MALRVRHGSEGAAWLRGCGMAQRVRHGSVGSMSARCKAGPSSNPDSAPKGGVCH